MALAALLAVAYGTRWEEAATLGRTSAQFRTPQATVPPLPVPGASANLSKVPIPVVGPAHILAVDGHELTVSSRQGVLHPSRQPSLNRAASSRAQTRPRVSCEGIPWGSPGRCATRSR